MVAALIRGRALAERLMTDTCIVRRATGATTVDPSTFVVTPAVTTVYTGKFKIQTHEAFEQDRESAESTAHVVRVRCDFPVASAAFMPGDLVSVTASETDALLVGRHYRLTVPGPSKTHATAYRLAAEELVGAEVPTWA